MSNDKREIVKWYVAISMFETPNTLEQLENKLGMSLSIAEEIVFKLKHQFTHMTWDISVFSVVNSISF